MKNWFYFFNFQSITYKVFITLIKNELLEKPFKIEQKEKTEKIDVEKKENEKRIKKLADNFYKENKNNLSLAICYLFYGQTKYLLDSSIKNLKK